MKNNILVDALACAIFKRHKENSGFQMYELSDLVIFLPHCLKDDLFELINMKITYCQFKARTLKAIGARAG